MMRLDKYLCDSTDLSRKEAKRLLARGFVCVNGERIRNGSLKVDPSWKIEIDGDEIEAPEPVYILFHKPAGYECTHEEEHHPSVFNLIEMPNKKTLHFVGRLDFDTTGLLLITDDGQWSHRLTSPKHHRPKTYRFRCQKPLTSEMSLACKEGILLRGEETPTLPAELEIISEYEGRLTIYEGRYHQVKRMFSALGNRIESLHRERIGNLTLDTTLAEGEWRFLKDHEVENA